MRRQIFSRGFKLEAAKLIRGVASAARDIDVAESVLRRWVQDEEADPGQAFRGHGQS